MRLPDALRALALAAVAGLLLAGCEPVEQATGSEGPPPPPPPVPFDGGSPPADSDASTGDVAALPPIDDNPQQLMGLDRDALNEKLGQPALIRRDGDAEVWQYRANECVLDLFLYGVEKRVEHVDLRDRGNGGDSVRDCFVGMLRAATPST